MIVASRRYPKLITQYAPLRAALSLAYAVPPETPVVIRGERGTGKTLLGRTLRPLPSGRAVVEIRDDETPGWNVDWDRALLIDLPPLRDRMVDIPLLAIHFAGAEVRFSQTAMDRLQRRPWPGNVAELRDVVRKATAASRRSRINPYYIVCGSW